MKKVMKRSFSLVLALLMLLCMFPVSAFAAEKKCTLVVGRNGAPFRTRAHQESETVTRYDKGESLTYTRLYINDALNLWYGVPLYDKESDKVIERFIYSGNVKKTSTPKDAIVAAQVEISRKLLNQGTCLELAKKLLDNGNTGYTELYMAKEIFAHACAYYVSKPALELKAPAYLTEGLICKLFPNSNACDVSRAVKLLVQFSEYINNRSACVEIGEEGDIESVTFEAIYEVWWDFAAALKKSSTTIF